MCKTNFGFSFLLIMLLLNFGCNNDVVDNTKQEDIFMVDMDKVFAKLVEKHGNAERDRILRGVKQISLLWNDTDGGADVFERFCLESFISDKTELDMVFQKISTHYESIKGMNNNMSLLLQEPVHLDVGPLHPIDQKFAAFNPSAHFSDDMFANKLAFYIILNFPNYTLQEKNSLGKSWTQKEWAFARLGDLFTERVPAENKAEISNVSAASDIYIAEYNIFVGSLLNENGATLFPKDLSLISHWGLRDQIKALYPENAPLERQRMLYQVMKRIISQEIPQEMINSGALQWDPYKNELYEQGQPKAFLPEPDTRYQKLLDNFKVLSATDRFYTGNMSYIERNFDRDMEISQPEVEALFMEFLDNPVKMKVAKFIEKRLGRKLEPFDIWYDGFNPRSTVPEEVLSEKTRIKYPDVKAFENDIHNILEKLDFEPDRAAYIASKIQVDAARGSGHAWGAKIKTAKSHLRTRVSKDGMDYKGYNIAMHELGHTVEQTVSLYDVPYYSMNGVPNTAFTEALAFVFQDKDVDLLGVEGSMVERKRLAALNNFWSVYEIMGVSLVDMRVWKWMYANPNATAGELKLAVTNIAKEVWNTYFAEVFHAPNETLLAIYSHMIAYPLYLSAYAYGHLIEFQLIEHLEDKSFGNEVERIFTLGKYTPEIWMQKAVGAGISYEPLVEATKESLAFFQ